MIPWRRKTRTRRMQTPSLTLRINPGMLRTIRVVLLLVGPVLLAGLIGWKPLPQEAPVGYAIESTTVVDQCSRCHAVDENGRMSRISYLRKTPEGWQTSIRRMVALHGARVDPEDAREIVRYLSNEQGLAPEELRPGLFEVERRLIDHDYEGDSGVEYTCIQCHSMGRVITQRRTEEEWSLLIATHRSLYPLVDTQGGGIFRRNERPEEGDDPRQPMDVAIDHLSEEFPLETREWSAWAATKRVPQLAGKWALSGYEPGRGALFGKVSISLNSQDLGTFSMTGSYEYVENGEEVTRSGEGIVYAGYQWRGRSNPDSDSELREVMFVERDLRTISGRWFTGAYDEQGPDVTLTRIGSDAIMTGVHPRAIERGQTVSVTLFGANLPTETGGAAEMDFGQGVSVTETENADNGSITLSLRVDQDAEMGVRDLYAFGVSLQDAIVIHDGVDWIQVTPETGMARVGGAVFPKGYQTFDAIGYDHGPDGNPNTDDDLELGRIEASWSLDEYAAIFGDDDIEFVGSMRQDGTFIPALDGPNPERTGNRNNVGDVWVVATHNLRDSDQLTARAHLIVTVPLYMRFEPWREVDPESAATFEEDR